MRYENELIELMPMLRSYIRKVKKRFRLDDDDDVFQECILNAIDSARKTEIRNPKRYFIGVFDKTVKRIIDRDIKRRRLFNEYHPEDRTDDEESVSILSQIEGRVRVEQPITRRVWKCLKEFSGDRKLTARRIGCHLSTVTVSKSRLKSIYRELS